MRKSTMLQDTGRLMVALIVLAAVAASLVAMEGSDGESADTRMIVPGEMAHGRLVAEEGGYQPFHEAEFYVDADRGYRVVKVTIGYVVDGKMFAYSAPSTESGTVLTYTDDAVTGERRYTISPMPPADVTVDAVFERTAPRAEVDGRGYMSVQDALDAAGGDPDGDRTVRIVDDIAERGRIVLPDGVTLVIPEGIEFRNQTVVSGADETDFDVTAGPHDIRISGGPLKMDGALSGDCGIAVRGGEAVLSGTVGDILELTVAPGADVSFEGLTVEEGSVLETDGRGIDASGLKVEPGAVLRGDAMRNVSADRADAVPTDMGGAIGDVTYEGTRAIRIVEDAVVSGTATVNGLLIVDAGARLTIGDGGTLVLCGTSRAEVEGMLAVDGGGRLVLTDYAVMEVSGTLESDGRAEIATGTPWSIVDGTDARIRTSEGSSLRLCGYAAGSNAFGSEQILVGGSAVVDGAVAGGTGFGVSGSLSVERMVIGTAGDRSAVLISCGSGSMEASGTELSGMRVGGGSSLSGNIRGHGSVAASGSVSIGSELRLHGSVSLVLGGTAAVDAPVTLHDAASLTFAPGSETTVSSAIDATGSAEARITNGGAGRISVLPGGSVTTSDPMGTEGLDAVLVETPAFRYTSIDDALHILRNGGADEARLYGNQTLYGDATVPESAMLVLTAGSRLAVDDGASLTVRPGAVQDDGPEEAAEKSAEAERSGDSEGAGLIAALLIVMMAVAVALVAAMRRRRSRRNREAPYKGPSPSTMTGQSSQTVRPVADATRRDAIGGIGILEDSQSISVLLYLLDNGECIKSDIYSKVSHNRTMTRRIDSLNKAGLIRSSVDGRTTTVSLAARGRIVAERLSEIRAILETDGEDPRGDAR